ncbi:hypothetical protein [Devosia psychrophila]|nr:hypothetical protein [Devosia psychrophila]
MSKTTKKFSPEVRTSCGADGGGAWRRVSVALGSGSLPFLHVEYAET